MRENNHILMRNNYQEASSYKIRQPLDDRFCNNKQNQFVSKDYTSQQNHIKLKTTHKQINNNNTSGYYLSNNKKPVLSYYEDRSQNQSRDLSYQSKGSNISKNSIKMTDYVALQAKNLLNNRDKYKFEPQVSHARSSSMQYYPRSQMKFNTKNHYTIQKSQQQGQYEIPSFGLQCRSTTSSYQKPQTVIHHNTSTSIHKQTQNYRPQLQGRNYRLKTEIDERIQRLRKLSNSSHHKERMNSIKVMDASRIENMDKINIKIKNILRTLESEEDHYKRNFTNEYQNGQQYRHNRNDNGNITKFQKLNSNERSYQLRQINNFQARQKQMKEHQNRLDRLRQMQNGNQNYNKPNSYADMKYSHSHAAHKNQQLLDKKYHLSQINHSPHDYQQSYKPSFSQISAKYNSKTPSNYPYNEPYNANLHLNQKDLNVSSYYFCENQQAMLKSSQSPIKSTSQKSPNKNHVSKWNLQNDQILNNKNKSTNNFTSYKLANPKSPSSRPSSSRRKLSQQKQYPMKNENLSILNNIPQCETQLIESKAFQNLNNYHTFDSMSRQFQQNNPWVSKKMNVIKTLSISQERNSSNSSLLPNQQFHINKGKNYDQLNYKKALPKGQQKDYRKKNQVYLKFGNQRQNRDTYEHEKNLNSNFMNNRQQNSINQNSYNFRPTTIKTQINQYQQLPKSRYQIVNSRQPEYYYSDSIKETPRINQTSDRFEKNTKRQAFFPHQNQNQLDNKLKNYEKRIQNYQKEMSASKLLDSHRSKSLNKSQINLSKRSFINYEDKSLSNNISRLSQRNLDQILTQQKNQKYKKENNPFKLTNSRKFSESQINHKNYSEIDIKKSIYQAETSKKSKSPRQNRQIAKQDHKKFIQNLRRERQQVAALSKRKNKDQNSNSVDFSRLSPLQRSNLRSESQNSRLSSNTIVKGKNVDAQIEKIQKKMEHFEQMKKQLLLQSQQNIQRSLRKKNQSQDLLNMKKQSPILSPRKSDRSQKSPRDKVKIVKFNEKNISNPSSKRETNQKPSPKKESYRQNKADQKPNSINSIERRNNLLKLVAEQNSYVKVRKSIIKQHKNNDIKNYLNQQIQKQSSRQNSVRNQSSRQNSVRKDQSSNSNRKSNVTEIKQNISPSESRMVENQNISKSIGQKKVVLGLAQNLNNFQNAQQQKDTDRNGQSQNDVNTPKLLRNLKNKPMDKSIVKKKAQKRGFRSQFINDLHEDNELIYSAKKNEKDSENVITQKPCTAPECKETLHLILGKLEEQILRDEKFRNQKKLFNFVTGKDKWTELMNQFKTMTKNNRVTLTQVMDIFTLSEQESNPFYSTRGNEFTLKSLVQCYIDCEQNWKSLAVLLFKYPIKFLQQCGFNSSNLDKERKGYVDIQDLTRFINMEINKYYRKRDLYMLWKRIQQRINSRLNKNKNLMTQSVKIEQLLIGLGAQVSKN